jgi:hypothetical protein
MYDFARHNSPLQEITRTVENPGSVLWIDNVWPGFDEKARAWMVENYLDGVHLHTLGLNDGKGHLYVYSAAQEDYAESAKMLPAMRAARIEYEKFFEESGYTTKKVVPFKMKYSDLHNRYRIKKKHESAKIIKNEEIYPLDQNQINFAYSIKFQTLKLALNQKKHMWCDEISIMDNNGINIAFSKRCLGYNYSITNPIGNPFYGSLRLGDERVYEFDNRVLFMYDEYKSGEWHSNIFDGIYKKLLSN